MPKTVLALNLWVTVNSPVSEFSPVLVLVFTLQLLFQKCGLGEHIKNDTNLGPIFLVK